VDSALRSPGVGDGRSSENAVTHFDWRGASASGERRRRVRSDFLMRNVKVRVVFAYCHVANIFR
jgi:hypothetical protein